MTELKQMILHRLHRLGSLRHQPLSRKLFVFASVLIIIPLTAVGLISYEQSSDMLEEQAKLHSLQTIKQMETHIEYYVHDFEVSILKVLNHPDMQRMLHMRTPEEVEQSGIRLEIRDLIRAEAYSRPDISYITILLDNIGVIDSLGYRSPYPASELKEEYWYEDVPYNGLPLVISRSIPWPERSEPVISLIRRIQSPRTLRFTGMIIMDINFRRILEISDKFNSEDRYFYILDAKGYYVYHPDPQQIGKRSTEPGLETILSHKVGTLIAGTDRQEFLTYSYSPKLGWTFVTSIPYQELRQEAGRIGELILWTALMTLTAAYLLGLAFAGTIIQPIHRLQRYMKKIEVGDFSETIVVESRDEIGQLSQGFNKMVGRLSALMEEVYFSKIRETEASLRQKEMEVKVLQSQINPHFLCNSLETIRGMALVKDNEDIANMAASLGALLRYNLRNTSPTVPLGEEIHFCTLYLKIQQYRFEQYFCYEIDIPEWALDMSIVKFALQPLVENCLLHSLQATGQPTVIRISAMKQQGHLVVQITDTGAGIPPEVLCAIRRDLTEKDISGGGSNLGIINVHRRIVHVFGPEYGIEIESQVGLGTQVYIRLPMMKHTGYGGLNHE